MAETEQPKEETVQTATEEILAIIAGKIREDSQNLDKLTGIDTVNMLVSDLGPDEGVVNLADMQRDSRYQDIKSVGTSTGAVYLYSETHITENHAEILAQDEDNKVKIAEKIRDDSKNLAKLTGVDSLITLVSDLEADKVDANVAELLKDNRYQDIKSVIASTGAVYLYSEIYITKNYADILVRAEANDPCATIAATVRDEARIYPRATRIEFFTNPIFGINTDEFEGHLASILERPEYTDIKLITASTEARYLYSDLYMNEDYARSLVEGAELDHEENP